MITIHVDHKDKVTGEIDGKFPLTVPKWDEGRICDTCHKKLWFVSHPVFKDRSGNPLPYLRNLVSNPISQGKVADPYKPKPEVVKDTFGMPTRKVDPHKALFESDPKDKLRRVVPNTICVQGLDSAVQSRNNLKVPRDIKTLPPRFLEETLPDPVDVQAYTHYMTGGKVIPSTDSKAEFQPRKPEVKP